MVRIAPGIRCEFLNPEPIAAALNRRPFQLLFMCLLVVGAGNPMLLAIAPPLVREVGLPDSSIGWIFSLSALMWAVTSSFWGRMSDRIGRKPAITIGLAAFGVSMCAFGAAVLLGHAGLLTGAWLFFALIFSRAIFGAFGSAASPSAQAYVAERTTRQERVAQLATLMSAFAFGQAFGPAVCAALAAWFGLVFPIFFSGIFGFAAAYAIWRLLPEDAQPKEAERPKADWRQTFTLIGDQRISGYLFYGFALSLMGGITTQTLGLFTMDRLNVAGEQGAGYIAAGFMVTALSVLVSQTALLPRLKWPPRTLMIWGAAILACGIVLQIAAPALGALLVAQAVQGLGAGLARPGFTGGASLAVGPNEQGAVAGAIATVNGSGFVFSPIFSGVFYEHLGMNAPLVVALALTLVMVSFAVLSRRLRGVVIEPPPERDAPPQ